MNHAPLRRRLAEMSSGVGRYFELASQAVILVWVVTFSIETLPTISTETRRVLNGIETGVVILFTAEYLTRLWIADDRKGFVFSFFGIVDLIAILPFYLSFTGDLSTLRIVRLFRLTRLLKLGRYNAALQRLYRAWRMARDEFTMFLFVALLLLFVAAAGIHHFEHDAQPDKFESIFDSLWWAVSTLTTVGYGDVYPITAGGRAFTVFVLMVGLGIVAVPTGLITAALTASRTRDSAEPRAEPHGAVTEHTRTSHPQSERAEVLPANASDHG